MQLPLFRQEVLDEKSGRWAGSIVLLRPVPVKIAAALSGFLAIAVAIFLLTGHYTRRVTMSGRIVAVDGAIKAVTPQFGRVTARHVREGDTVAEGQVLYELSSERAIQNGGVEQRVAAALSSRRILLEQESRTQTAQLQQRQVDLKLRQELLTAESAVIAKDKALQLRRVTLAEGVFKRFEALRAKGFVSDTQLMQTEVDLAEQQSKLQTIERGNLTVARELALVSSEASQTLSQIELGKIQVARALASLEQENVELQGRGGVRIVAPARGIVTALLAEQGESVNAGATLATIVPKAGMFEAHLQAPSNAIGLITEGQTVRLRIAAFPYQKFGYLTGKVRNIEHAPSAESVTGPQAKTEASYRIAVTLDKQSVAAYGIQRPLRVGMALEADIKQDRRRLIEWLVDPIKSVATVPAS